MAKYSLEEAAAVLAIKQVIYEWGDELDLNNGETILERNCLTSDVEYFVGGEWRHGIAAVKAFYRDVYAPFHHQCESQFHRRAHGEGRVSPHFPCQAGRTTFCRPQ
jgi:ketosteroid isomerase-like protein